MLVIQSLIRREGHLIVIDDGRQAAEGEGPGQSSSVSRNDKILVVASNYVID
jgi:DNA replication licensing factor MCM6